MADFNPTYVALEGFRIGRENPRALLAWWAVYFVAVAAAAAIAVQNGALVALENLETATASGPAADPAQAQAILALAGEVFGKVIAVAAPLLFANVLVQAGTLRRVLRPVGAVLALGGDELRILAASLVSGLLVMGLTILASMVVVLIGMVLGAAVMQLLVFVAVALIFILVGVGLSLLAPMAVAERRFSPAAAFALTRGRFSRILLALILATGLALIISLLGAVVAQGVAAVAGVKPDVAGPATLAAAFSPSQIALMAIQSFLQVLSLVALVAPSAAIYRALKPGSGAAEVF